ncbi:MAG: NifB/NifX family molybdenum-iron cluster-binding protein [Candidatus Nezhaarchaeales archaeon]
MESKPIKIAFATTGTKGIEDDVSHEFGRSKTFTVVDIEGGKVKSVKVIQNPATTLSHGKGPVVAKYLSDLQVNMVVSGEFGPGASILLNELKITKLIVKPGQRVIDVLKEKGLIS